MKPQNVLDEVLQNYTTLPEDFESYGLCAEHFNGKTSEL